MRRVWQLLAAVYVTVVLGGLIVTTDPAACLAGVPSAGWRSVYESCHVSTSADDGAVSADVPEARERRTTQHELEPRAATDAQVCKNQAAPCNGTASGIAAGEGPRRVCSASGCCSR